MPKIPEVLESKIMKDIDNQKYLHKSKLSIGSAIHPKFPAEDRVKPIIDLDPTFKDYKSAFKKRLSECWNDALKVTQPYRFDPLTNKRGSMSNLPEPRNNGYRIGNPLVNDMVVEEAYNKRRDSYTKMSVFARNRKTPKGVKHNKMLLAKADNGGYYNPRAFMTEEKIDLPSIIEKQ